MIKVLKEIYNFVMRLKEDLFKLLHYLLSCFMRLEYHNHGGDDKERRTKVPTKVFLNNLSMDPSLKMSPSLVSQIHNVTVTGLSSLYITKNL